MCRARIDRFEVPTFAIHLSGSAQAQTSVKAETTHAILAETSQLTLNGESVALDINASGASQLEARSVAAQTANLTLEGASHADVNVDQTLNASLKGASSAVYRGNPTLHIPADQQDKIRQE